MQSYALPLILFSGGHMDNARLAEIQRPAQYIGGEYNSIVKDWSRVRAKMAFCFPDTYEIGMSHLGLRLLYEAVNREGDLLMERCFAPMEDMRLLLLESGKPLCALESGRALADFDVLGFTLQYELSYTNVLDMLHLAQLPLLAAVRTGWPLIIAGGPCAFNPEPLADFIDLFCIGESEQQLPALLKLVAEAKEQGLSKDEFLHKATKLPGIYVPENRGQMPEDRGQITKCWARPLGAPHENDHIAPHDNGHIAPQRIQKALLRDMNQAPFPNAPILPHTQVVHDRIMLELMRGCGRGCRFCQSGIIYRPVREKQPDLLLDQAQELAAHSGYEDIGLISLSSADYSQIGPLMQELVARHGGCGMGLSLPSLRVDAFSVGLAAAAGKVRKSGLTFAPEAGSQRLRDIINKGVQEEDIISALTAAFAQGYSTVKLYFMIGLPYETMEDIAAIAALCKDIAALYRGHKPAYVKKQLSLSLGVASFVPKAHTPFQWCAQDSAELLRQKQRYLLGLIRPLKQVSLRYHDVETSLLEAALARGDRRLGAVLQRAWQLGCHADGWTEHFKPQLWREAFAACGLTPEEYACRAYEKDDQLPWQHIESGVSREWLWREYERAAAGARTEDCRHGACSGCGVCSALDCRLELAQPLDAPNAAMDGAPKGADCAISDDAPQGAMLGDGTIMEDAIVEGAGATEGAINRAPTVALNRQNCGISPPPAGGGRQRWRLRLAVDGPARWLSQLDMLSALEKALRRSGLPLAFSQGFNPHMLISWGPAHGVGLAGDSEYTDLTFAAAPPTTWPKKLNALLPPGLRLLAAVPIADNTPSLMAAIDRADYTLELAGELDGPATDKAIAAFLASESYIVERSSPKGHKKVDIRPALLSLIREEAKLIYSCRLNAGALIKPQELIQAIAPSTRIGDYRRTAMYIGNQRPEARGQRPEDKDRGLM
jgi:radical SAM family uncharacterized protein/radical SAM-linked protein